MCSCSYAPDPDIGFSRFFRTEYLYYPKELHFTLFIARVNFNEEHPEEKLAFIYFFSAKMSRSTVLLTENPSENQREHGSLQAQK